MQRCVIGLNEVSPWKRSNDAMTFWLKRFWLSLPKTVIDVGLTALTPDGVGSVRDSASVSLIPVKLKNQSFPRNGRSPLIKFWLYGSSVAPSVPIGRAFDFSVSSYGGGTILHRSVISWYPSGCAISGVP